MTIRSEVTLTFYSVYPLLPAWVLVLTPLDLLAGLRVIILEVSFANGELNGKMLNRLHKGVSAFL